MTEIKPCPFCGTEWSADPDATMVQVYHNGPCEEWMVFCEGCGTESSNYSTLDEAIAAWDQRTPDPEALITGLREARLRLAEIEGAGAAIVGLLDSEEWLRTAEGLDAVLSDCRTTAAHLDTLLAGDKS